MSGTRAYDFAFYVGVGGTVSIFGIALLLPHPLFEFLLLSFLWALASLFLFPWLYVCYRKGGVHVPPWFYRGPHQ